MQCRQEKVKGCLSKNAKVLKTNIGGESIMACRLKAYVLCDHFNAILWSMQFL